MSTDFFTSLVQKTKFYCQYNLIVVFIDFFMAQSFGMKIEKIEMFD